MTTPRDNSQAYPLLDLTFIKQQLTHSPVGHTVIYHTSIPSTMPVAAQLAKSSDTPSGVVVTAEEQSSGRGRRGRSWQTPYASALLMSILLKPPHASLPATTLTMVAGNALLLAVAKLLPELQGELHLKWPNDLVFGRDPANARKLAGILAESSFNPDGSLAYAILGIGVNVNQQADELPRIAPPTPRPISLRLARNWVTSNPIQDVNQKNQQGDSIINRSDLLVHLCRQLGEELTRTPIETFQQWKSHLSTLGQRVAVYPNGPAEPPAFIGQAVDVQEDGALLVADEAGNVQSFHAADVSIRTTT